MEKDVKILKNSNNALKKENKILRKDVHILNTKLSSISKPITNNTINGDVNIMLLNAYGKEDLSHLTSKEIRTILNHGFKSIPKYIEYVHFSEDAPYNKNICISNRRDSTVNIYNGKKWILKDKTEFLEDIREKEFIL